MWIVVQLLPHTYEKYSVEMKELTLCAPQVFQPRLVTIKWWCKLGTNFMITQKNIKYQII